MDRSLIAMKDIVKVYGKQVKNEVIHGISLEIKKGEFLAIIGPSGSGKSTLLNMLGALDRSTSGEIWIKDQELSSMDDDQLALFRNRNLGFVFQFHHLLPEFTALENVLMPKWITDGSPSPKEEERALELLEMVGLKDFADKLSTKLSGGQKQRVAIARALMNQPAIVFADEPTGNLDSQTTERVYQLLRQINQEFNTTFIIVTHNDNIAQKTDRIIKIVDGNIQSDTVKSKY